MSKYDVSRVLMLTSWLGETCGVLSETDFPYCDCVFRRNLKLF